MSYNKEACRKYYIENKDIIRVRHHEYWAKNKEKYRQYHKEKNQDAKMQVLRHYSVSAEPFCFCCGEKNHEFLAIDHVNGGGNKHRAKLGFKCGGGSNFYSWLAKNNYPDGYRVLCHNCNFSLGLYGYCPHERVANV